SFSSYVANLTGPQKDREGIYKSYKETEENITWVRGRVMFNQHLYNNLILSNKVYCDTQFTEDVLENQIIKFTLHKLLFELLLIRSATAYYEDIRIPSSSYIAFSKQYQI
ncbi:MAG: hypothetical protein JO297_05790, partial [Nitrososphaeraceae archaeon]|nr:hypothetical protein [Nitrososphaeraceae archaeon]